MYIWQNDGWPHFFWDANSLLTPLADARHKQGQHRRHQFARVVPAHTTHERMHAHGEKEVGVSMSGAHKCMHALVKGAHLAVLGRHGHAEEIVVVADGLEVAAADEQVDFRARLFFRLPQRVVNLGQLTVAASLNGNLAEARLVSPRPNQHQPTVNTNLHRNCLI